MDVVAAIRQLNSLAYGYIGSWALLTACDHRLFDRLPATLTELGVDYPDAALLETWLRVLEQEGVVAEAQGVWSVPEVMASFLTGANSYADYLRGQILGQLAPRLSLGHPGENELGRVLRDPESRTGYAGWFDDTEEARRYQQAQFAGSLSPGRMIAEAVDPRGRVLDLGGGWGAVARAVADVHDVEVDVVDFETVVDSAPAADGVRFEPGSALDAATWPVDVTYEGAILSYLLSSVPGETHQPLFDALAERGVGWVAVHDFFLDGGSLAPAWSLQHAVFVRGHRSRTIDEVTDMLTRAGFSDISQSSLVPEMTVMIIAAV